jgi:murein DD-endopeptidase MepM/ murein hydrolase activator NlpD
MLRRRFTWSLLLLVAMVAVALPVRANAQLRASDPVTTITDLEASNDAISPGRGSGTDRIDLAFTSRVAQHVRISVSDQLGRPVRTVVDADIAAGPATYSWDGTRDDGSAAADGDYEMVVEADAGNETMSVSDVVRVDRHAPTITTPSRVVRMRSGATRSFPLPVVASERTLVTVATRSASGRTRTTLTRTAGRSTIDVPIASGASFRRALARGRARVAVTLVAGDDAGNQTTHTVLVDVLPPLVPTTSTGDDPVVGSSKLSWPLSGPITSRFGQRWGRMHEGIDLGVPTGRPIGSAAPGRVTYAGWMSGYGNTVMVDHGSLVTLYGHQSRIAVHVGQSVARGQVIGYVGSTGNSTGPHLHFEVRVGGTPKDPLRYLP